MLIKDQTGVKILYNESALKNVSCKDISLENVVVEEALKRVLLHTGFGYSVVDGVFVIKEEAEEEEKEKRFQISGTVTDEYKTPLPGVTVLVKEGKIVLGTATSSDGKYKLTIPGALKKFSVSFSFVGMETKVVEYSGNDTINVVLKEDAKSMDEVVVTVTRRCETFASGVDQHGEGKRPVTERHADSGTSIAGKGAGDDGDEPERVDGNPAACAGTGYFYFAGKCRAGVGGGWYYSRGSPAVFVQ